jgi:hypothetical protein
MTDLILRNVIQNPNGQGFQNEYTSLGKIRGKKQLAADCRRLNIRVSSQALQTIEKGFSHKSRVSYSNIDQEHTLVWGNDEKKYNTGSKGCSCEEKKKAEEARVAEETRVAEEIRVADEKTKKASAKKQKKWEKEKKKMANLDSWEDIRV